jgi:Uma2 family endonuclease
LIVELLSPDSQMRDRREKRLDYKKIAALHTCALVSQERREIQVFRRKPERGWTRKVLPEAAGALRIPELEFSVSLDAIYARTAL